MRIVFYHGHIRVIFYDGTDLNHDLFEVVCPDVNDVHFVWDFRSFHQSRVFRSHFGEVVDDLQDGVPRDKPHSNTRLCPATKIDGLSNFPSWSPQLELRECSLASFLSGQHKSSLNILFGMIVKPIYLTSTSFYFLSFSFHLLHRTNGTGFLLYP